MLGGLASDNHVSKSLGITADWTMALQGRGDPTEVLDSLRKLLRADSAMLVRAHGEKPEQYIAVSDAESGRLWHAPPRSCARAFIGEDKSLLRAGAIWKMSEARQEAAGSVKNEMTSFLERSVLREVVLVALQTEGAKSDYLELHFRKSPAPHNLELLTILASTLAACWSRRLAGVISKRLIRTRLREVPAGSGDAAIPILDIGNPAKLSRCEYRICTLLNEGMTVNVIADTLSVCQTTVRSHLSSIFAKTGTSSQIELLHQLNRDGSDSGPVAPRPTQISPELSRYGSTSAARGGG